MYFLLNSATHNCQPNRNKFDTNHLLLLNLKCSQLLCNHLETVLSWRNWNMNLIIIIISLFIVRLHFCYFNVHSPIFAPNLSWFWRNCREHGEETESHMWRKKINTSNSLYVKWYARGCCLCLILAPVISTSGKRAGTCQRLKI